MKTFDRLRSTLLRFKEIAFLLILLPGLCQAQVTVTRSSFAARGSMVMGPALPESTQVLIPSTAMLLADAGESSSYEYLEVPIVSSSSAPDNDSDGVDAPADCDDNDPAVYPGAAELCDGKDNNCDGQVDEGCVSPQLWGTALQGGPGGGGTLFTINPNGGPLQVQHVYKLDVQNPASGKLLELQDGSFVGMGSRGGASLSGGIFRIFSDGHEDVIFNFNGPNGKTPNGSLIKGADGFLYGMTSAGGVSNQGTIFKVDVDGSGHTILFNFNSSSGMNPSGDLIQVPNGKLFGMTYAAGPVGYGTVFGINQDGSGFEIIHNFEYTDGGSPLGSLTLGPDSVLYGLSSAGGLNGGGALFRLNQDGSGFSVLHNFADSDNPRGTLLLGRDGRLYGTTTFGGSAGLGTVFSIGADGSGYTLLLEIDDFKPYPTGTLVQDENGILYGTTIGLGSGLGSVFKLDPNDSSASEIVNFNDTNGLSPTALVIGSDRAIYGMTNRGGATGRGTIYKVNTDGSAFTLLSTFNFANENAPVGSLIQGIDSKLYGVTRLGGSGGYGTVFSTNWDGSAYETLVNFDDGNGGYPMGALLQGLDGKLYGTTRQGGSHGHGTIFTLSADGTGFTTLHNFDSLGGRTPYGNLIQGSDGKLYGTTLEGGASDMGTLFRVNIDGNNFDVLFDFETTVGSYPYGALLQDSDGQLYGTTAEGGAADQGVVFAINPDGTGYRLLVTFDGTNGSSPKGSLVKGNGGVLVGTAIGGGSSGDGILFKVSTDGSAFTALYEFNWSSGSGPTATPLIYDNFVFAHTGKGGANGLGVVFKYDLITSAFTKLADLSEATGKSPQGSLLLVTPVNIGAPTVPASNILFSNVFSTQLQTSLTAGDGMKRLVVLHAGDPVDFVPQDDVVYTAGQTIGTNRIVMNDSATSVAVTGLQPGTTYHFTAYEYNESGTYTRYITTGAPVASQVTLPLPDIYVTTPANGAVDRPITLNVTARALTGATTYTIELNDEAGFTGNAIIRSGARTQNFTGLAYAKTYYTRAKTDLSPDYGQVTTFQTLVPNTYVTSPPANATNRNTTLNVTASALTGATLYTIELNEAADFSGLGIVQTGSRTLSFTGLKNDQQYYTRVKTDAYPEYGTSTTFHTAIRNVYVTTPANNAVNQNVSTAVTARLLTGATDYTIELNEQSDFSGTGFVQTGGRTQNFTDLDFGTKYYARVKTDLSPVYGQVTSFTTATADYFAYVTSPASGAVNVNTSLNITSNTVPRAVVYTIQLSEDAGFSTIDFEVTTVGRTLAFSGLKYSTTYFSRVKTDLSAEFGQVRQFTTRTAESIAYVTSPADGATNVNNTSLNITANTVAGATSYTIQLSEFDDFSSVAYEVTGPTRTLAFSGLAYNKTYYNRVMTNAPGTMGYGAIRSFATRTAESLAYVTSPGDGATAVNVNSTLNVRSNTVPGATTYTIELNTDPDFLGAPIVQSSSSNTVVFSGLAYNTLYYNRVQTDLSPVWGATRSFTTGNPSLNSYITSPTNVATNVKWVVNVTANNIPGAVTYTIEANTQDDFLGTSIVRIGTRTQSFTLEQDQTYHVRVMTNLYAEWGPTRSFTTGNALSLTYVTSPVDGGSGVPTSVNVVANWLPGATSYTIELNTAPDFSDVPLVQTKSTRTIAFSGLAEGTTYYSRVKTSLNPGQWGTVVRSFTTEDPAGRVRPDWMGEDPGEEEVSVQAFEVKVFSNPFRERLGFLIASPDDGDATVELLDASGRRIHQSMEKVNQRIEIGKPMAQGLYLLRIATQKDMRVVRVVKVD